MYLSFLAIAVLLAAGTILVFIYLRLRSKSISAHEAGVDARSNESRDFSGRVLWDIADGGRGPVVRKGKLYLDRRSFLSRMTAAAMALIGLAVASSANAAVLGASGSSGPRVNGAEGDHTDTPHHDQSSGAHTDISCDPPTCDPSQHADTTQHDDTPHIDYTPDPPPHSGGSGN